MDINQHMWSDKNGIFSNNLTSRPFLVMLDDVLAGVYANVVLNVIVIGFNVYGVSVI